MDVSSIFNLPTALESDGGGTNAGFRRVTANRSYEGQNFSNGIISFDLVNPMHRWWHPARSFFKMRFQYGAKDPITNIDRPIFINDGIALSQNLGDHLFQTAEYQAQGQPLCKIYQHMPQIGVLRRRMNEDSTRQKELGRGMNFESSEFQVRQIDCCRDGRSLKRFPSCKQLIVNDGLLQPPGSSYQVFKSLNGECMFTIANAGGANNVTALMDYITSRVNGNCVLRINELVFPILNPVNRTGDDIEIDPSCIQEKFANAAVNTVLSTCFMASGGNGVFEAEDDFCKHRETYSECEIMFQLPLPIFDQSEYALPGGKHSFLLNPHTQQQLFRSAFESRYTSESLDTLFFNVKEFYFMAFCVDNDSPSTTDILLDFKHIRMQSVNPISIAGTNTKQIDVRPTTSAIALAFQDSRCSNNSMFAEAVFSAYPVTAGSNDLNPVGRFITNNLALALERYSIEYGGVQYPVPDADMKFELTGKDFWTQQWVNTLTSQGTFFKEHPESFNEWIRRGPYFFHLTLRPGLDRSTRVAISTQWNQSYPVRQAVGTIGVNAVQQDFDTMSLLVFDFSRQAVKIQVKDGQYSDIVIEEQ